MKSHTKKLFDPFKRKGKFDFKYDDVTFTTTVGQLNFLKWVIVNDVIAYIEKHYDEISAAHSKHQAEKKKKTESNKAKKANKN